MRIWGKEMGKRILIGSMLVLTLLLLMPSIPAVQQKSIEEGRYRELQEKLETFKMNDLKDIDVLGNLKYPILQFFVIMFITLRTFQIKFLMNIESLLYLISDKPYEDMPNLWNFLFKRIYFLFETYAVWIVFWQAMSMMFDWNWSIEPPNN